MDLMISKKFFLIPKAEPWVSARQHIRSQRLDHYRDFHIGL